MKFLKKFNTEEEYEAYLNSDDFVRPCVARIVDDKAVHYKKRYKNVVYVQHVNGNLFTTEQWTEKGFSNDAANGVAVVAKEASFVIAKTDAGTSTMWSSDTSTLIDGILTTADLAPARTDFAGQQNTELMLTVDTSKAAYVCANYTFPNGSKGYLPALGEWYIAYQNKSAIDAAMALIGGTAVRSVHYWSSTQGSASNAWRLDLSSGYASNYYKSTSSPARAFTSLT
jgi:hypothetical protein